MQFQKRLFNCSKNIIFSGDLAIVFCWLLLVSSTFVYSFFSFSFFNKSNPENSGLFERSALQYDRVRVLLHTVSLPKQESILITTHQEPFTVFASGETKKNKISKDNLLIQYKKNSFFVNGKRYKGDQLELSSDGYITYADRSYHGTLLILKKNNELLIINEVPLEEYICSVLKTESWPGWPLEVNKVFAITSRTYVISMMQEAHKVKRPYDVHNCNRHQTYSGVHDKKILQDAVKQTSGVILTYENEPIIAMFDSCCGGVIPADVHDVNFEHAPYLARTYACKHCQRCWIYNWKAEYTLDELRNHLFAETGQLGKLKTMAVAKNDKAGLVEEVRVLGKRRVVIKGKKLYSLLKEVKSYCFTITKERNKLILHGRGYGHHLGLCQWGAREMVRDGWDYRRILQFYYPKTTFMRFV